MKEINSEILSYQNDQLKECTKKLVNVIDSIISLKHKHSDRLVREMGEFNKLPWYKKMFFRFNISTNAMYGRYLSDFTTIDLYLFKESNRIDNELREVLKKLKSLGLDLGL